MTTLLLPNHVGDILPFSVATCDHLEKPGIGARHSPTFGRVFKNGQLAWIVNGDSLEVVSTKTGERHATWELDADLYEDAIITCVSEVKGNNWYLLIGIDNGLSEGLLCIFDIKTSRVIKTLAVPYKVASVEVISAEGGVNHSNVLLCPALRFMCGIAAVGTQGGNLYLIDLMLDDVNYSDELVPSQPCYITPHTLGIPNKREEAAVHNRHLAVHLNDRCSSKAEEVPSCSPPAKDFPSQFFSDRSSVSALLYVPQTGTLISGFSFGSFQIWSMTVLQLLHSSEIDIGSPAVIKFAFQEPENDPRNVCYLWVVQGQPIIDVKQEELARASLYCLVFDQKQLYSYCYCYMDFSSCYLCFHFELTHDVITAEYDATVCSRLISCGSISEMAINGPTAQEHNSGGSNSLREESVNGHGLCCFVWESTFIDPSTRPVVLLAIFDINQWYQAEMPTRMKYSNIAGCPYFGFFSVCEISERALPDFLLDVCVLSNTISYMRTNSTSEQFFYPSSLAFDVVTLIETGVIRASFLGVQRQILHDIKKKGSAVLVSPQHMFDICVCSNLLPLPGDVSVTNLGLNGQRETILSLALEYNLIDFIIKCASEWACGKNTSEGCCLWLLQEWAWKRVHHIKTSVDKQCVPLFDFSGITLDAVAIRHLHHLACQLRHLELIFKSLSDNCHSIPTTDQGIRDLENRMNVISLLALYLEVTLWFTHFGLLPECEEDSEFSSGSMSYPGSILTRFYSDRRSEIQRLSSTLGPTDVLLIDGILKNAGDMLVTLWEKDGGNGMYPPPSFHALLNTYLLPNINIAAKHQIVQYLFLDLTELLSFSSESSFSDNLMKFPAAFSLSPSIIKFTQGIWLLDHKDYEEAISVLLHPIINSMDILPWQHSRIMKAFLYQGEPQKALRYARIRRPAMVTSEEIRFHLTVLLANGLVAEAYEYQKSSRDQSNTEDLLHHFFIGCKQTKNFRDLLNLPLSPIEESHLIEFLHNCGDPHARELLVIYYLQRARYVDAMFLNEQLLSRATHQETDSAIRERSSTRNAIVNGFSKLMPRCHNHLTQSMKGFFRPGRSIWQEVPRPQPLSTHVIASKGTPVTQTSLIETVMSKIAEVWSRQPDDYSPMKKKPTWKSSFMPDVIPLIGTPTTPTISYSERLAQVVFPNIVCKDSEVQLTDSALSYSSPTKRSRFLDVSPCHVSLSGKRHSSSIYNSEALTLLQTPPVRRKLPLAKLSTDRAGPPSILKVRSLLPSKTVEKSKVHSGLTPTPPITPEIISDVQMSSTLDRDSDIKKDERHLRFRFSPAFSEDQSTNSSGTPMMPVSDIHPTPRLPLSFHGNFEKDNYSAPDADSESYSSSKSTEVLESENITIDSEEGSPVKFPPDKNPSNVLEPVQVSVDTKQPAKEKTPSPRPRTSFFSAERSKEHYIHLKTEVSRELAKAGGSTSIDLDSTEIEVVEAESPLAMLVKQTLDSVFSKHSDDSPPKLSNLPIPKSIDSTTRPQPSMNISHIEKATRVSPPSSPAPGSSSGPSLRSHKLKGLVPVAEPLTIDVNILAIPTSSKKSPSKPPASPSKSSPLGMPSVGRTVPSRYSLRKSTLSPKIPSSLSPQLSIDVIPKGTKAMNEPRQPSGNNVLDLKGAEVSTETPVHLPDQSEPSLVLENLLTQVCAEDQNTDELKLTPTKEPPDSSSESSSTPTKLTATQGAKYYLRSQDEQIPGPRLSASPKSGPVSKTPFPAKSLQAKTAGSAPSSPKRSPKSVQKQTLRKETPELVETRSSSQSRSPTGYSPSKSRQDDDSEEPESPTKLELTAAQETDVSRGSLEKSDVQAEESTEKRASLEKSGVKGSRLTSILKRRKRSILTTPTSQQKSSYTFHFSDPTAVDTTDADPELLKTPPNVTTFIFSPPLTRSRSRKSRKVSDTSLIDFQDSPRGSQVFTPDSTKLTRSAKKQAKSQLRRLSSVASETPINFVSPEVDTLGSSIKSKRLSSRLSAKHGMILRKPKGALLSRRSAKLQ